VFIPGHHPFDSLIFPSIRTGFCCFIHVSLDVGTFNCACLGFQTIPGIVAHFTIFRLAKEKYLKMQKDISMLLWQQKYQRFILSG